MERGTERGRGGGGRGGRRATLPRAVGTGTAVLAALLVVGLAAASAPGSKSLSAPWTTAHVKRTDPTTFSGCGTPTVVRKSFFNKTTGVGGFSDSANATECAAHMNNSAEAEGTFTVDLPIHVKTNGTYNLTILFVTVATGSVNLTAGSCSGSATTYYSGCTRGAGSFVYGTSVLKDRTTGTTTKLSGKWPGNSTYVSNYTSCVYTKCSSMASKRSAATLTTGTSYWAWYYNGTSLSSADKYTLVMTVYGGAYVRLVTTTGATLKGASGVATLNSASLGNYEELYSVTLS